MRTPHPTISHPQLCSQCNNGVVGWLLDETGKANTSRALRNIKQASKIVKRESEVKLAKEDAQSLAEAAQSTGMVDRVERHENGNWVIWVK